MSVECCLFDLGNVLVFFSHEKMISNVTALTDRSVERVHAFLFDQGWQARLETGRCSNDEFHTAFQTMAGVSVDQDKLLYALSDIFELNTPMIPLLQELNAAGVRLVLLSNTCQAHIDYVQQKWDFLTLFDAITTSWEAGAMKPDAAIYQDAIRNAGCPGQACFYTDDIPDYVQAAEQHGIQAHLFKDAQATRKILTSLGCLRNNTPS